jgi:hypothetical protein
MVSRELLAGTFAVIAGRRVSVDLAGSYPLGNS